MNKTLKTIHRILYWLSPIALVITLVIYLMKWNSLPHEIGVHFGSDGKFDVIAEKYYGFYWQVMGGVVAGGTALAIFLINRINIGLKLNEKGEKLLRTVSTFTLDIMLLPITAMFVYASRGVIIQKSLDRELMQMFLEICFCTFVIGLILSVVIYVTHKNKVENKESSHAGIRLSRIAAWLIEACDLLVFFLIKDRLPGGDKYYDAEYEGLAYFANLDRYMSQWLILVPHAVWITIFLACEILASSSLKKEKFPEVRLANRVKVTTAILSFWWNISLCSENSIGIVSVAVWAGCCLFWGILYLIGRKKQKRDAGS